MQVILQKDVAKLGRRFDVVEVANGYGMNKLIPQGLAKPASPENLKQVGAQAARGEADAAASAAAFTDTIKALAEKVVDVSAEANEDGKLYRALPAEDIVAAIAAETELHVPADQIVLKDPVKHTGEHTIEVAHGTETGSVTINVIAK